MYRPLLSGSESWDFGKAKCEKHDLYVEFHRKSQLKKLTCFDERESENGKQVQSAKDNG
jgi:hypothetical protein